MEPDLSQRVADKLLGIDLKWHTLKILTVSTAMISNATGVALSDRNHYLNVCVSCQPWYDTGWLIYVGEIPDEVQPLAPELFNLLTFAKERGYDYLRLDADDSELPVACGFPSFSW